MKISDLINEQKTFLTDQLGEGLMQLAQACDSCLDKELSFDHLNELLFSYMQHHQYTSWLMY